MFRLKTLTRPEGRIRLSEDDGPPATEFLEDDYDDDIESLDSNETLLAERAGRAPVAEPGGDVIGDGWRAQLT